MTIVRESRGRAIAFALEQKCKDAIAAGEGQLPSIRHKAEQGASYAGARLILAAIAAFF
jgi:hypothetical protein